MSGLCFLSKLVEQVVAKQHINNNKLDNPYQSAYKPGHSTETALLSIKNEVHLSLERGEPTALVLPDLSAVFDTIDHNILLGYLKSWFGLDGTVLKWFASYLSERYQSVKIGSTISELRRLIYGVPQGLHYSISGRFFGSFWVSVFSWFQFHHFSDINIHLDVECGDRSRFNDILQYCSLIQCVNGLTHIQGHTLDILLSPCDSDFVCYVCVCDFDHAAI